MSDPASSHLVDGDPKSTTHNKDSDILTDKPNNNIIDSENQLNNPNVNQAPMNTNNNANGNPNNYINSFIMTGNTNSNSGTNLANLATRRDSSVGYGLAPRSNQRNDSINGLFNNFNLPRFSTDSSIAPFLNMTDNNNASNAQNNDHFTHPNDPKRRSQDLSQIARGYSIVNNSMWTPPIQQHNIPHIANPMQTKIAHNHVDPLDINSAPKFKPLSFSGGKLPPNDPNKMRNDSLSVPPSNRGSSMYPVDNQDLDMLHAGPNKSGALPMNMKPPTILPTTNNNSNGMTQQQKYPNTGYPRTASGNSNMNFNANSNIPLPSNQGMTLESFFTGSNSRKNSLKLGNEDLDFDNKRRNSSIKLLLDNNNNNNVNPNIGSMNTGMPNQMIPNNGPVPKDMTRHTYPGDIQSMPSSLSRFSSMMNLMGNEANNAPHTVNEIQNNLNNQSGTIHNTVHQQAMPIPNSASEIQTSNIPYVQFENKKRVLGETDISGKGKRSKKSKSKNKVKKENTNTIGETLLPQKTASDLTNNKRGSKKGKEKRTSKKSSFEDVLKKITQDSNMSQDIDEATLVQQNDKDARDMLGVTKIDELMLMIDARKKGVTEKVETTKDGKLVLEHDSDILPPTNEIVGGVEKPVGSHGVKQHECKICHRFFTQLTHLEVHIRSHIGYKPFECQYCKKRFTQGGNLRTHLRLHTGERPYECGVCGKKFSRKGNMAAHTLTHQKIKPFVCELDNCHKTFTQLGNMKAHQNRFHQDTLNKLTERLAKLDPNETIDPEERRILDYFASLYKNSNKGIKGRGRDRTKPGKDKSKTTNIVEPGDVQPEISPEYRLYQTNQNGQVANANQPNNIPNTDIRGGMALPLGLDFQPGDQNSNTHQIPDNQDLPGLPLEQNEFLQGDQQNGQMMEPNGVDFKFVNYKK